MPSGFPFPGDFQFYTIFALPEQVGAIIIRREMKMNDNDYIEAIKGILIGIVLSAIVWILIVKIFF